MQFTLLLLAIVLGFLCSHYQSRHLSHGGPDQALHLFMIDVMRENRRRLFTRVPRLLDECYCGAHPLFFYWALSFLNEKQIETVSRLLNPAANSISVATLYLALQRDPALHDVRGWLCLCLAATPQFFHFSNARVWGLSARPLGLLFFLVLALLSDASPGDPTAWPRLAAALVVGYLIWGVSTFAQQTMVFFALFQAVAFDSWSLLLIVASSLLAFVALQPRYALSYLKHTVLFSYNYATNAAGVFILKYRYSLWRDLVLDAWRAIARDPKTGLHYLYNNSVFIVVFLNPLAIVSLFAWTRTGGEAGASSLAARLALTSLAVFVATSFRATRFLGEPERYVEMATAFSTVAGAGLLYSLYGGSAFAWTLAYFLLLDGVQLLMTGRFRAQSAELHSDLPLIRATLDEEFRGDAVRFASNNIDLTKRMLTAPYQFATPWSPAGRFGGRSMAETFSIIPYIKKEAVEAAAREHRINALLLDHGNYRQIFDDDRHRLKTLLSTERYSLFRIEWDDGSAPAHP